MAYADAEMTSAIVDGLADAITVSAFVLGNEKGMAAIIRALTEMSRDPKNHASRNAILRRVAMQLHDNRTLNAAWKTQLLDQVNQDQEAT